MDDRTHTVKVTIFGTEYAIRGDADPAYVNRLAKYVEDKMLELTGGSTSSATVRLAVLAALNVADELFQLKEELKKVEGQGPNFDEVDRRLARLAEKLDESLSTDID